jgi:NTE family protein
MNEVRLAPTVSRVALILTGGGARAAYQVGVLRAMADMLPRKAAIPFPIICGTSAGAINAVALATEASNFRLAALRLATVWKNFHVHDVYRSDPLGLIGQSLRWLTSLFFGGFAERAAVSLLDNAPLAKLLAESIDFTSIRTSIDSGCLSALSITASGYSSGQSVSFFAASDGMQPWRRARRIGVPADIGLEHLMASSALPFIFPAVRINREFFGDGSMRQIAPISPALHLGADRILVVGVGRRASHEPERVKVRGQPTVAQIAGHALNSIFLDSLEVDIERLERINRTISLIPQTERERHSIDLRPVKVLVLTPSEEIDVIAARHAKALPPAMRLLMWGVGANRRGGSTLMSYILFERSFTRALMKLGYRDTIARRAEVLGFLGREDLLEAASARIPSAGDAADC